MTSDPTQDRLYDLLPSVYRVRDAERDEALRALLGVIEGELRLLEDDIGRLYDNYFIETCDGWVVPYLGDLLGVSGVQPVRDEAFSQRALVANTLAYRRRKGTASVLEQLARDVTGWPAKAVEFFELLATTQYLNHVRPGKGGTVNLRDVDRLGPVGNPFEDVAHLADVRHIDNGRGKYNIPNVGLFLWRLQPYPVVQGSARAVVEPGDGRYRFSPLGNDAPLFNRPQTETEISQLATERNVSGPLRRRPLYEELEARRSALKEGAEPREVYFGDQPVLRVLTRSSDGAPLERVPPEEIEICHLGDDPSGGWRTPSSRTFTRRDGTVFATSRVAVDPELGRLAWLVAPVPDEVHVGYAYGFPGDLGGGPYERRATLAIPGRAPGPGRWEGTVRYGQRDAPRRIYPNLTEALDNLPDAAGGDAIITITDSATYDEEIDVELGEGRRLTIQAANGARPVLRCASPRRDLVLRQPAGGQNASVTLNGLLIEGGVRVERGSLELLRIVHCTLVPGHKLDRDGRPLEPDHPSVTVADPNNALRLEIDHSVTGRLRLPPDMEGLRVHDSIIDSPPGGEQTVPALVSEALSSSVNLSSAAPAVDVTIGGEGPHRAVFQAKPTTLPQAQTELQAAIRAAHDSPAFENARVIRNPNENHLVVLPGVAAAVTIETVDDEPETPEPTDPTASELGLDPGSARETYAYQGGIVPSPFGLTSASPSLTVSMGDEGSRTITLSGDPQNVAQARDALQAAIRAGTNPPQAFGSALVADVENRLVVLPGVEGATVAFDATPDDRTTLAELALEGTPPAGARPAIAASDEGPGPPATLERTTVFGAVHVRELTLASETIFTEPVTAVRRQAGCARFSYVPEGSRTPRQFRCQPDQAVQRALGADPSATPAAQDRIRDRVRARVAPSFTSVRYGEPGYAQLGPTCAEEISTGAEDENEMGAYNFLQQAQRMGSLRTSLDEYLRLGLEAGILLVT
jgi:hypothetical protein